MNLTKQLAEYAAGYKTRLIETNIRDLAKQHMLDTFACLLCGTKENVAVKVKHYLEGRQNIGGISLITDKQCKVSSEDAALYYGVCSHVCDYDDLSKNFGGHPGAVVLPVVFALGEETHCDGETLLRAFIAGVEMAALVGSSLEDDNSGSGWNRTSVIGIIGGVAAGAIVLNMDVPMLVNALGIAASEASGLKVNYGSEAKNVSVGQTASKAIFSLHMAQLMVQSDADGLGADLGLFQTIFKPFDSRKMAETMEESMRNWISDFLIPGIILKPYPSCRGMHNGIDGMIKIVREHKVKAAQVKSIVLKVQNTVIESNRYPIPSTPEQGKFSLAYCMALCLLNQTITADDFSDSASITPEICAVIKKVSVQEDRLFEDSKSGIEVIVTLGDGTIYSERGYYAKGDPKNPMSEEAFAEKLNNCFSRVVSKERTAEIIAKFRNLETWKSVGELM